MRGVGAQQEDAVVPGLVSEFAGIDREGGVAVGVPGPHPTQVAPVGGVADQRLIALAKLFLQAGDDRLAVGPVLLRLGFVAADDVTGAVNLDLFHEQLGLAAGTLDQERRERRLVVEHRPADHRAAAFARPQDVFEPALFEGPDGRRRDRA